MEDWRDQGIVLSARPHGESGAVVALLTETHGRHAGYMRNTSSSSLRATLQPGTLVDAAWRAPTMDNLGSWSLEPEKQVSVELMDNALKLSALLSACALCDAALPEREPHPGLFYGTLALLDLLEGESWGPAYIMWEIAFLRELGFALDLTRCAGGGDPETLAYISPKSGHAVSLKAGKPYKEKLLPLPDFLKPGGSDAGPEEILKGLQMTAHFLEHWAFAQHTQGVPEARVRLMEGVGTLHKKYI